MRFSGNLFFNSIPKKGDVKSIKQSMNQMNQMNQNQRENHEMIKILKFKIALLTIAAIEGCGSPPSLQQTETVPSDATATPGAVPLSCVERSAATRPPKHPIVELAWCIAETDELYDPDHLFHENLGIAKYGVSEGVTWGIQVGANAKENSRLPEGIRAFIFMRKNPKGIDQPGDRYLSFELNPKDFCVRITDVEATFGTDSWLSAVPLAIPAPKSDNISLAPLKNKKNPYGVFYKSPRLFMRDVSGQVSFYFAYEECVRNIAIQSSLDAFSYRKLQEGGK